MTDRVPEWAPQCYPTHPQKREKPFKIDRKTRYIITGGTRKATDMERMFALCFKGVYERRRPVTTVQNLQKLTQIKIMQSLIAQIYNSPATHNASEHPRLRVTMTMVVRSLLLPLDKVIPDDFERICKCYAEMLEKCPDETKDFPMLDEDNSFIISKIRNIKL